MNAHFDQLHLNAHPLLKLFPGCTCHMKRAPGGGGGSVANLASCAMHGVAVLSDGRFVTGSRDSTVKVWKESSPGSGEWSVEATLTGHGGPVYCVAVADASTGEPRFVTGSGDTTVKVWKESSPGSGVWSVEATLSGHDSFVVCVAVLADGRLVTGSGDYTVNVWVETSRGSGVWSVEMTLTEHSSAVCCVAVLPPLRSYGVEDADASTGEPRFVTGSRDGTVKVWKETSAGFGVWSVEATLTRRLGGHSSEVTCVAVLPNASTGEPRFVTGSHDGPVKVWVESSPGSDVWSVEATLTGSNYVMCVAVLADGRFVTGSRYGMTNVWKEGSPGNGRWELETFLGGRGRVRAGRRSRYPTRRAVYCVAVLPNSRFVAGFKDGMVKVWKEASPGSGTWDVEVYWR